MKDSLPWARFWITLSNCKLNNWLWSVEFASRTLGCQSRVSEGLGTMLGWPGSPAEAVPQSLGCGWNQCVYRLAGDAEANECQRNSAAHFAGALSCTHFRGASWGDGGSVCWFWFGFFETKKAVGLIASPFWMAASVPRDHVCRTQWEP